ncbi:MAG: hypothetical protein AB9834_02610 [Lentimicrobium sp.]
MKQKKSSKFVLIFTSYRAALKILNPEQNIEDQSIALHFLVHCIARLLSEPDNFHQSQATILAEHQRLA